MTILMGAVGAIVGGLIADALGVGDTAGIDWNVAILGVWIYSRRARAERGVVIPEG